MTAFLWAVFASVLGAAVYAFFFGGREERIREYLRQSREGWNRRRYIRALLEAARGHATSHVIGTLLMILVLLLGGYASASFTAASFLESRGAELDRTLARVRGDAGAPAPAPSPDSIAALFERAESLLSQTERVSLAARAYAWLLLFICGWILFSWMPFAIFRARFAAELERFTVRIQPLASETELKELTAAETAIRDEASLRRFVEVMQGIANRHDVSSLVSTFNLWPQGTEN